jgi:hypothetical protein
MITQMVDLDHFHLKARQIRARLPAILSQWGLTLKFNRWRLAQDPGSGMVVLFAVLNTGYMTTHAATSYSSYFDSRLLSDLANDLHMHVVPCNRDGLCYAFILDQGGIDKLPAPIDFPFLDGDRLFVRVVSSDKPVPELIETQIKLTSLITTDMVVDQSLVNRVEKDFLMVLDDNKT